MTRLTYILAGVGVAAGLTATLALSGPPTSAAAPAALELVNPDRLAGSICSSRPGGTKGRLLLAAATPADAPENQKALEEEDPPLWKGLGKQSFPISHDDPKVQAYFDQGLRMAYGFNHFEARRAFRAARRIEPDCAICYWGEALVLGPNINAPMFPEAVEPAFALSRKAVALKPHASDKEKALIDALVKRYPAPKGSSYAPDSEAYADAMAKVAAKYSGDHTIQALYAEAMMDTQPWDYWEADKRTPKGRTATILKVLEGVLEKEPDHPAAIHLYIHMVEASTTPGRAESGADKLAALMPSAGHLVHMPSHIYYRIGRYKDSLETNVKAVKADEAYFSQVDAKNIYRFGYYPHNVHFVMVSAQMAGDRDTALSLVNKLDSIVGEDSLANVPWAHPIKAAPYFALAQFGDAERILKLPEPNDRYPYIKAMWHYARGIAYVKDENLDKAEGEAAAIARLTEKADFSQLTDAFIPAYEAVDIAQLVLKGKIAQTREQYDEAIVSLEKAVKLQDDLPYTEPPYWYYPVRQTLGATMLMADRAADAERVFMESLMDAPNNGWALYGLMTAQKAKGDKAAAKQSKALFRKAWAGEKSRLELAQL
ncbi:MAG: tetratricopeptide repeat protein [Alphaproteobacteria bacterium]